MKPHTDLSGRRFDRLTAIEFVRLAGSRQGFWRCRCDCGNESFVYATKLIHGGTHSCGCGKAEAIGLSHTTHGLYGTPYYHIWNTMLKRCYNPNTKHYVHYGGRGIRVCEFFRVSPANLLLLLSERPSSKHVLDRTDNNGHYSCGQCAECMKCGYKFNVRWATPNQSARNKRSNRLITHNGITKCVAEWAEACDAPYPKFHSLVYRGRDPFVNYPVKHHA